MSAAPSSASHNIRIQSDDGLVVVVVDGLPTSWHITREEAVVEAMDVAFGIEGIGLVVQLDDCTIHRGKTAEIQHVAIVPETPVGPYNVVVEGITWDRCPVYLDALSAAFTSAIALRDEDDGRAIIIEDLSRCQVTWREVYA
jgi:hypothetical protein